ncbi:MAG: alkaline phosphatase family protein [Gemmatimonadetes bacterium]|nr:alkaline phosphatase family protein [Gemmatimonadota bacterium]
MRRLPMARVVTWWTLAMLSACARPARQAPSSTTPASTTPARKAVFIILDGIPADVIERVATPALDDIARRGGYARAHVGGALGGPTQTPTISAPGYMSLLTGTWANKHNVWNNSKQSPNYAYWNLFRIVEAADASRVTAIFSTWLDNRTVLVGEGRPGAGDFRIDHAVDGLELDTIAFPHDKASQHIRAIDDHVTNRAAEFIAQRGPDLTWVYLQHTDDVGHAQGTDGEAYATAVREADARVGRIWAAVQQRASQGEAWMIVVTTDHGRDPVSGKGHGGQTERERTTWIVTNQGPLTERFTRGEATVVDLAPSILQHLGITPPAAVAREFEGVSLLRRR